MAKKKITAPEDTKSHNQNTISALHEVIPDLDTILKEVDFKNSDIKALFNSAAFDFYGDLTALYLLSDILTYESTSPGHIDLYSNYLALSVSPGDCPGTFRVDRNLCSTLAELVRSVGIPTHRLVFPDHKNAILRYATKYAKHFILRRRPVSAGERYNYVPKFA